MNIVNQFSYPLIGLVTLFMTHIAVRHYLKARWYVVAGAHILVVATFAVGLLLLRPGSSNINDTESASATVGNGRPTFIAFFSNYCSVCLALNPIVDSIEDSIQDDFDVLRINIHTQSGRTLRENLGFSFTPEFVLYDPDGNETWRDHIPPTTSQIDAARTSG